MRDGIGNVCGITSPHAAPTQNFCLINMTRLSRLPYCAGIAIGPILFVIAILAILAAAIAAGSGSFTDSTTTESSKLMASTLLQQAQAVDDAVNLVRSNGFDDTKISFTVLDGLFSTSDGQDYGQSAANGYTVSACTTSACKVYSPGGGGLTPEAAPIAAMDMAKLNAFAGYMIGGGGCGDVTGQSQACRAPTTTLVQLQIEGGASALVRLAQAYYPLNQATCMAINNLVGIANSGSDAPASIAPIPGVFGNFDTSFFTQLNGAYVFPDTATFTSSKDFCAKINGSLFGMYVYWHVFK